MRKLVTSAMVWMAYRRWQARPTMRAAVAYQRIRHAYENRFPNRRLDFLNRRVEIFPRFFPERNS
jgi:hypothetical protein